MASINSPYLTTDQQNAPDSASLSSDIGKLDKVFSENPTAIHNDGSEYGAINKKLLLGQVSFSTNLTKEEERALQDRRTAFARNSLTICSIARQDAAQLTSESQMFQKHATSGEAWNASIKNNPAALFSQEKEAILECTPTDMDTISLTHDVNPVTGEIRELNESEKINRKITHGSEKVVTEATDLHMTDALVKEAASFSSSPIAPAPIKSTIPLAADFSAAASAASPDSLSLTPKTPEAPSFRMADPLSFAPAS